MDPTYYTLDSIATELDVTRQDVEAVAVVEVMNEEWDEEWEAVTAVGRQVILAHFGGGQDPA